MASEAAPSPGRLAIVGPGVPESASSFAEAVREGLVARPKILPCRYFYDASGSRLFERICALPEYYLTRTEDAILAGQAAAMVAGWSRPPALIELGSGSASKTRRLIAAALYRYGSLHYLPIDVSPTILEESARALVRDFPGLRVTGYADDYHEALARACARLPGPKLVVFLGSSLGNFEWEEAVAFLGRIASDLSPEDRLLLGTDLDKAPAVLEAAYDDAAGITARFNRNLLARINRELGGQFRPERFAHRARYRPDPPRIEMHLVSLVDQEVPIPGAGLAARFAAGEVILTEKCHKYRPELLRELAHRAGCAEEAAWTDPRGWFRIQRWKPRR